MAKAKGPADARAPVQPQQRTLNEKEAAKLRQQGQKGVSTLDRERIASQAGFQRLRNKKGKAIDLGDGSALPYALPEDDADPEAWSQESLQDAQGSLSLAGAQLGEIADMGGEVPMADALVGGSFLPGEDNDALRELAEKEPDHEPVPLDDMEATVRSMGIELEGVPVGQKVLAAGLVVAGERDAVELSDEGLQEGSLAEGVQRATQKANQSVDQARRMNEGIESQLSKERTMFRR